MEKNRVARPLTSNNKDADDLGFILRNYFIINENRIIRQHSNLYYDNYFTIVTAGTRLIGRDMADIMKDSPETKQKFMVIIHAELQKPDESKLIDQILKTNKIFKYEEILKCLHKIIQGLND
jgi:predicted nucleotidyltransferase